MPKKKSTKSVTLPVARDVHINTSGASDMVASSKIDKDQQMKWKAEDALRDIERAEGHKKDKELMPHVKKLAKEKMQSLKKIC